MKTIFRGVFLTSENPALTVRFYQLLAHLASLGVAPCSTDDVVVTVVDPDGRKVMFGTA